MGPGQPGNLEKTMVTVVWPQVMGEQSGEEEWIVDSGATSHMCRNPEMMDSLEIAGQPKLVATSNGDKIWALGQGIVHLRTTYDQKPGIKLDNVKYVPELARNIISISELALEGYETSFTEKGCEITLGNNLVGEAAWQGWGCVLSCKHGNCEPNNPEGVQRVNWTAVSEEKDVKDNLKEPQNWTEVTKLPSEQRKLWSKEMEKEIDRFEKSEAWEERDTPPDTKPIGCRWTYSLKKDSNGLVVKRRARLVAQGFNQVYGKDFDHTYAPVVKGETLRTLLTLSVTRGLRTKHVDIDSAFLYGPLEANIYMKPPDGPWPGLPPGRSYFLKKAIYGLRQAAKAWYDRISRSIENLGLKPSTADQCLFVDRHEKGDVYLVIHVDDLLLVGTEEHSLVRIMGELSKEYSLKDLGPVGCYLGIQIEKSDQNTILLHQREKIEQLIKEYSNEIVYPSKIPMTPDYMHDRGSGLGETMAEPVIYQRLVGSLMHLSNSTRPDISQAVSQLSRHLCSPSTYDYQAALRVLGYLGANSELGVRLGGDREELISYTDADWGGDKETRRSTSGAAHFIGGGLVSWSSLRQSCVALSTAEAEYVAAAEACKDMVWLRLLLSNLGCEQRHPSYLYCDNQGSICMASTLKTSRRTKHIDIKFHFLRDMMDKGTVLMGYCNTRDMVSDIFTKPLPYPRFKVLVELLHMY